MLTITIDDEKFALNALTRQLKAIDPSGTHDGVLYVDDMLEKLNRKAYDIAFIDVDLKRSNGISLTKMLSEKYPTMNIIMYTGHPEYKADALDLFVSGYLVKPAYEEEIKKALAHLRYPIKELTIRCFGEFDIFYGNDKVMFKRRDSKEILAYLVDNRGTEVSEEKLRHLLWGDEKDDSKKGYIRNLIYDIRNTLSKYGCENIIRNTRGFYSVDAEKVKCDYYDYLAGKPTVSSRLGEYMEQYNNWSWETKKKLFGDKAFHDK